MDKVKLPTDDNGFITQECPECGRKFKIEYQQTEPGKDRRINYCPYCTREGSDFWWTDAQMSYMEDKATQLLSDEFEKYATDLGAAEENKEEVEDEFIEEPVKPVEKDFGKPVKFKCHEEKIKVVEEWEDEVHCIICEESKSI